MVADRAVILAICGFQKNKIKEEPAMERTRTGTYEYLLRVFLPSNAIGAANK